MWGVAESIGAPVPIGSGSAKLSQVPRAKIVSGTVSKVGRGAPFYHRLADRCRTRASILDRRLVSDAAPVQILRMAVAMRKAHTSMRSQREQMRQMTRVEECPDAGQAVSFRASRRPIRQFGCPHSQPSIGFRCSALRSHGKPPLNVREFGKSRENPWSSG